MWKIAPHKSAIRKRFTSLDVLISELKQNKKGFLMNLFFSARSASSAVKKLLDRRGTEVVATGSTRNRLGGPKLPRGFESHPLRQETKSWDADKPTRCINLLRVIMKTPVRIASQCNYEAVSGDHFWRPSTSVIPGLTRNPGFLSGFPPSRE